MARTKNFDEREVLEKALDLFWRKGYNATSVQDLVDELGINRASLYHTWGDKHRLYLSALNLYRQNSSLWLLNEVRSEKPAKEVIKNFLYHIVDEAVDDIENKGCFVVNSTTELANCDVKVNEVVNEARKTLEEVLTELIKEGQETGEIQNNRPPASLARFIHNTISGLRVIGKGNASRIEMRETVEIVLSMLELQSNS